MSESRNPIKRHPLIAFFVLAYAVAWGFVPFGSFGAFGPLVAALIVVPLTRGRAGLREWGARLIRWVPYLFDVHPLTRDGAAKAPRLAPSTPLAARLAAQILSLYAPPLNPRRHPGRGIRSPHSSAQR